MTTENAGELDTRYAEIGSELRAHVIEAHKLGVTAAENAASWSADGNTSTDAIRATLRMIDDGDPGAFDRLPNAPDLSGEWADESTPQSLARDILGDDCPLCHGAGCYIGPVQPITSDKGYVECDCSGDLSGPMIGGHASAVVDLLAETWETAVSETFETACEAELRRWVDDGQETNG